MHYRAGDIYPGLLFLPAPHFSPGNCQGMPGIFLRKTQKSECLIFIQPVDSGMLGPKAKLIRVFSARLKALANHCRRSKKCSSMPPSTQKRTPPKTAGISAIALLLEATGIASKYAWEATAFLLRSNPQTVCLSLPLLLSSY